MWGFVEGKPRRVVGRFCKMAGSHATAFDAELWGVQEGLKLARASGFLKVELRLDSVSVWFKIALVSSSVRIGRLRYCMY